MGKTFNPLQPQEGGRISPLQLSFLAITVVIATADVFLPAFVAQDAQKDSWIAVIIGTITSIIITNILLVLALRYPDKTLIQYSCDILGKPLGKVIGFLYIYHFLFVAWAVTRELGEIFVTSFNPNAPELLFSIVVIVFAAYAVLSGIEVIARVNEIFFPIGMFVLVFIAILNIPNLNFKNFLPVFYEGYKPSLKGGILIQAWMIETVILLQFIPFTEYKQKTRKYLTLSLVALSISLEVGVLTIAVFGKLTSKLLFPALEYVRYARLGPYIQNLDISIMVVWIAGMFIKIAVSYYAGVLGLSQLFGFKSYKQMIIPAGILIVSLSIASAKMLVNLIHFLHYIFPFYSFTLSFIIPVFLLIVSFFRGKSDQPKTENKVQVHNEN